MISAVASLATAAGAVVLIGGFVRAAFAPRDAAGAFARSALLALEFLLAAGLLRLGDAMTFTALATVVAVIATRRLMSLGLRRVV